MTDEKRQGGKTYLGHLIYMLLLGMQKQAQDPQNAPRPGFKRHKTTPNPQVHKTSGFMRDTKWSHTTGGPLNDTKWCRRAALRPGRHAGWIRRACNMVDRRRFQRSSSRAGLSRPGGNQVFACLAFVAKAMPE